MTGVAGLLRHLAVATALTCSVMCPISAQQIEARADRVAVTVGDVITVRVTATLPVGAQPAERVLRAAATLPEGVRLLGGDTIHRDATGASGVVRIAIFRTGQRSVPPLVFALHLSDGHLDSLVSRPVPIVVASILPTTRYGLRDIKPLERTPVPLRVWYGLAAGIVVVAVASWLLVRRRARARAGAAALAELDARRPTPYQMALARLEEIARAAWPAHGEVERHFAAVAETVRRYLEDAHGVPALERTTAELFWSLPPALAAEPAGRACRVLLDDADLVKFARWRPDARDAARILEDASALLARWHAAESAEVKEVANAVG